ncbi:hypothetical protein AAFN88_12040 [Pelagibius sp. CAU 1746]|uniref:hypothetical protein n=1 Tax=Pelagibius sp. CAU 1746 TaxID=3140370 RepID=UPI00325B0AAB
MERTLYVLQAMLRDRGAAAFCRVVGVYQHHGHRLAVGRNCLRRVDMPEERKRDRQKAGENT